MHYRLAQARTVRKPDSTVYRNAEEDWHWPGDFAATAARWLQHVPFDSIVDERNPLPMIFVPEVEEPAGELCAGIGVQVPNLDDPMPSVETEGFVGRQRYRIVLVTEKSSLTEILGRRVSTPHPNGPRLS